MIEIIITPSVAIIIPKTPSKFSLSFNMIYSKIAIWITSVLLSEVPTTKFENLKRYNSVIVKVTCKIDPKKVKKMKLVWSRISEMISKSWKKKIIQKQMVMQRQILHMQKQPMINLYLIFSVMKFLDFEKKLLKL